MVEGVAFVAELICRYTVVQNLYTRSTSVEGDELERALIKLYAAVMLYLSKTKRYFNENSTS
jgi:hypothetical protein